MEKRIMALRGVHDVGKSSCLKELVKIVSKSGAFLIECGALFPYCKPSDEYIKGTEATILSSSSSRVEVLI